MPSLSAAEENALVMAIRSGAEGAKTRLVAGNIRLVAKIAKSFRNRGLSLEDLFKEGSTGLMQAVERFDTDKGYRFSVYATYWVRQAIGRAIDRQAATNG